MCDTSSMVMFNVGTAACLHNKFHRRTEVEAVQVHTTGPKPVRIWALRANQADLGILIRAEGKQ